jgi:phage shock protein C
MAYCSQCGQQNPDGAQFCNKCGHMMEYVAETDMDRRWKEFGEEVQGVGKRFAVEARSEAKGLRTDFDRTFGPIGPLVKAVIGFIILVIVAQLLNLVGDQNAFVEDFAQQVLLDHLIPYLLLFIFLAYAAYVARLDMAANPFVEPLAVAVGTTALIWVALKTLSIVSVDYNVGWLRWASDAMWMILPLVFLLILLLGYSSTLTKAQAQKTVPQTPPPMAHAQYAPEGQAIPGRVYRSGKDRILGGVCGGLGEHFQIDPTLLRVIWILLLVISFGTFLIVYIAMWIIIPRNPAHIW